ncbi:MAG: ribonuclease HII [Spirochaetes bacterium]|nr:ribonuclease HII [Spirochaetota bacterium]
MPTHALLESALTYAGRSYPAVIGVDEVGRGALFGPVTVGAVLLNHERWSALCREPWFEDVADSKLISEKKRRALAPLITAALPNAIAHSAVRYIDKHNISRAVERAIYKATQRLLAATKINPAQIYVLFDGKHIPGFPQVGMARAMPHLSAAVKADQKYFPVAAASIIAKVARDRMITNAAQRFAGYGLERHAGYGTAAHRSAIKELGLTQFHRKSFHLG